MISSTAPICEQSKRTEIEINKCVHSGSMALMCVWSVRVSPPKIQFNYNFIISKSHAYQRHDISGAAYSLAPKAIYVRAISAIYAIRTHICDSEAQSPVPKCCEHTLFAPNCLCVWKNRLESLRPLFAYWKLNSYFYITQSPRPRIEIETRTTHSFGTTHRNAVINSPSLMDAISEDKFSMK